MSVLSGGFHEFGHAAAARYSGAQPGAMGAGLYLVWPAFYTDVTDSYRLGRAGRIRTDLGGLYFNAIVVVLTFVWWWATGWEALLLLVATQVLQMVQQLLPLLRFDGYHVLADLAGVPDLYQRIRPTLVGLLPHRWKAPENRVLKPWARAVITLWVLVTVPMMALMLLGPRCGCAAAPGHRRRGRASRTPPRWPLAWRAGDGLDVAGHALQVLGVVLPALAGPRPRQSRFRFFGGLVRWSRGSAGKRLMAAVVSAAVVTVLAWAWWPHPGTYRPIAAGRAGAPRVLPAGASRPDSRTPLSRPAAVLPAGTAASTAALRATSRWWRRSRRRGAADQGRPRACHRARPGGRHRHRRCEHRAQPEQDPTDDTWVFPFDQPLPPGEGDNQALAVNTTDDSVAYDVAFALVWAEDDEVLNVNEAHAYASCSDCVTVAVAFQVVLIMDDAQVIVPQNLAVAANYDCYRCITAAIASQLVLSVQEEPGEEELLALGEVWNRLLQFANAITSYSLTEITQQLETIKSEIVAILMDAPPLASAPVDSTPAPTGPDPGADVSGSPTPSPSPVAEPTTSTPRRRRRWRTRRPRSRRRGRTRARRRRLQMPPRGRRAPD